MSLSNIRVVLLHPTHPGNVGASARALKTMTLCNLWLVGPSRFPSAEASARAAGAEDVLAQAHVCTDVSEAVADCITVIGASARARHIEWPMLDPRACAARLVADAARGPVALLFGRERTGLTNAELDRCQALVQIPANPEYPSLNVASAVQILAYEVLLASGSAAALEPAAPLPAGRGEMELFYRHLQQVLVATEFLDPDNPRLLMRRLVRLFNRANPDQNEVNILRGILTAVQRAAGDKKTKE